MSFKKFSSALNAPGKDDSAGKPAEAAPAGKPTTPPEQKAAEVKPAPKA